ncbi:tetratricopeptide repeat protein [Sphingomonas sp. GB1N7]|uniref:tetratricopeptide repeat protein n=1 Tax=Parasphingomonas caseinilytica TaxID=3096158 RepID=UPI002FC7A225
MRTCLTTIAILLGTAALPVLPATAQSRDASVEVRVDRLEGQMRAVQRKVFPSANGKLIQPEITGAEATTNPIGTPADTPVTDLTARVNALESQLSSMTGQIEQNQFKLRQIEEGFTAYKSATDARLKALEGTAAPVALSTAPTMGEQVRPTPAKLVSTAAAKPDPAATTKPAPTATAKDPARADRLAAVEKPATDDAGEDTYNYGYRLWEAKLYPEAETQFKALVKDYPQHRRLSRAQNMLGRALLDDGKPNLAVLAFYDNYRNQPKGDRAHESLYYLAQALTILKKPSTEICKVYDELTQVYPEKLNDAMKAGVAKGRVAQKCGK